MGFEEGNIVQVIDPVEKKFLKVGEIKKVSFKGNGDWKYFVYFGPDFGDFGWYDFGQLELIQDSW